ncbi:MbnP family copper-binding protein [Pseudoalteromonas denitrificans]|uniref:AZL_007920/MXAN_0976 family protein n=1 Tax=Pseudoalteromonas denitrificans DSM 6059 TaxID=1123010 RepID=A0A1I1DRE0_9GAMM|nr:MbnP family copper-binding protein [Pseudoalteromonas denitrificans]SFB77579.1 AZL_007920/MXAN_0976 family protein [Pseudoalteromonas denitrificans DSM 6059]
MKRFLITAFILAIFFIIGCQSEPNTKLTFIPVINGKKITCTHDFKFNEQLWRLNSFQFYLSKIKFNGINQTVTYDQSKTDVSHQVALLGTACRGGKNWQLILDNTINKLAELEFELAVPFELNHSNPLSSKAPLNQADMFWTWQLGHKFFRLDMVNQTHVDKNWSFHLGSTGCDSASVMRAPKVPCKNPNRVKFTIKQFDYRKPIYIHLDRLFFNLTLNQKHTCMGDANKESCNLLYENLNKGDLFSQEVREVK